MNESKTDHEKLITLTKALEFYADASHYTSTITNRLRNVFIDRGAIARAALLYAEQDSPLPERVSNSGGEQEPTLRPEIVDGVIKRLQAPSFYEELRNLPRDSDGKSRVKGFRIGERTGYTQGTIIFPASDKEAEDYDKNVLGHSVPGGIKP